MNNADYWARRFKIMEDALKDQSYEYVKNLERQFDLANAEIDTEIRAWYQRFAGNNIAGNNGGISYAEAKKLLTAGELEEFKWDVWEYIDKCRESAVNGTWIKELENASARVHISRLESIKIQLRQLAEELTQSRIKTTAEASAQAYTQSYYHTAFEVQRGLGVGWTFQEINTNALKKILSRPWTTDNRTFTARCWTDKNKLVDVVNRELMLMFATGEGPKKAIAAIAKELKTSKQNSGRVVMTESAYFSSAAQKDCFKALGVEQYRVISAFDKNTCSICGDMNSMVFKMSDYSPGSTAPPFHPWCRCCIAPYFEDMDGVGARYARDVKTGERYKLPKDITYRQWKEMQDAKYGAGTVDRMRKAEYNKSADVAQFERYRSLFGDSVPKTFEAFQKLKYDNPELWEGYKTLARSKNHLQQKLNYVWNGEKCFIPKHTKFEKVVTMAGKDTDAAIRYVDRLVEAYGGEADEWQKRAGKVTSDKYIFDLHWYESDGVQYEIKLKTRKERKRNEN